MFLRIATGEEPMKTLIVVPTYNERDNLPLLIEAIHAVDPGLHVLVVDDGSPDGTGAIVDAIAARDGRIAVIHRTGKLGLGTAYLAGFRYALRHDYDRIVQMDADFSHRPSDIPRLLERSEEADLVIGSRNVRGGSVENWSPLRQLISRGGSWYTRLLLHLPVRDCTAGFKCWRRSTLQAFDLDAIHSNGYGFQVEMNFHASRLHFRIAEIPVVFPDRTVGQSKMSAPIVWEAVKLVWNLRRQYQTRPRSVAT
jgi:dolichol-phosphate mannosyltransferase